MTFGSVLKRAQGSLPEDPERLFHSASSRPNAVFETVLHEIGHAVHWWLGWERTKPFFDATWTLHEKRQGEGIWGFSPPALRRAVVV